MKLFLIILLTIPIISSFNKRFYTNLNGNIKVIGNTVLRSTTPNAKVGNHKMNLQYVDIDSDSKTFNSSSATLESIINGIDISKSKIKWARLYWLGYLHNDKKDEGIDSVYNFRDNSLANAENDIKNAIDKQQIYFKIDDNSYMAIKPDKIDKFRFNYTYWHDYTPAYVSYIYSASADITNLLKDNSANHKYTVANIPTRAGKSSTGYWFDGLGNFSAWSLVIVYDNSKNSYEKMRNVTVFDGFEIISGWMAGREKVTINFEGFKTPKYTKDGVDSEIAIFAGEGDKYILGDAAVLTNQDGYSYTLPPASGTDSYFASSIDGVPNRNPKIDNNNGIDIHINQVGTKGGANKPIKTNQTHASLTLSSATTGNARDLYIPTVVAFSTELYVPKICYDYDLKLGDYINLESNDREINTMAYQNLPLQLKIMLRSKEADFDLIHSKMQIKFIPDSNFKYVKHSAKYSLPNTYEYQDAVEIDDNIGLIAVGDNPDITGGTISALESIYTIQKYDFLKDKFNGKFDIYLDAKINFDGVHEVSYSMSTNEPIGSIKHIPRCPTNPVYDSIKGMFNIERGDSTFSQPEDKRYPLYTQIVGIPYEVSIASYKKDSNSNFTLANSIKTTLELELIRADIFDNNSSAGYDSTCQNPSNYHRGTFIKFDNQERVKVNIPQDFNNYPDNLALKNATFRVWQLVKKTGFGNEIVAHNCSSSDSSSCFDNLYAKYYKDDEDKTNKACLSRCTNSTSSECYDCLRAHFAIPICARDNFAIRPNSYSIIVNDNNETKSKNKVFAGNNKSDIANIASGYFYNLDINATRYGSDKSVDGYDFKTDTNTTAKQSILKFTNSGSNCTKVSDTDINIDIFNGKATTYTIDSNKTKDYKNLLNVDEVGNFNLHIEDNEWTLIDQKGYKYKPFPNSDDCIKESTATNHTMPNSKRGCQVSSNTAPYKDLRVTAHPYRFDISNTTVKSNPNGLQDFIYINDLNSTKDLIKNSSVMAINVNSSIVALNRAGAVVNNYKKGCMAENINTSLAYSSKHDSSKTKLQYSMYVSGVDSNVTVKDATSANSIDETLSTNNFINLGTGIYNNYINYKREFNKAINPFSTTIDSFYVDSPKDKMVVDMKRSFIPSGAKDLNVTKNIYYAKTKSKQELYDDIIGLKVNTPISITIFCDKALDYCKKYGIDTNRITNEYNWFVSAKHNALNGDGVVNLKTDKSNVLVVPSKVENFVNGTDKNVTVKTNDLNNRPYTVHIMPTVKMKKDEPWLLFNKYSNTPPDDIYKVRFTTPSASWSGQGKTGHTINEKSSGRKTNKVDW